MELTHVTPRRIEISSAAPLNDKPLADSSQCGNVTPPSGTSDHKKPLTNRLSEAALAIRRLDFINSFFMVVGT